MKFPIIPIITKPPGPLEVYYQLMGRIFTLLILSVILAAPAQASPTDPDANDWVSIAVSPATGTATYGGGGSRDQAIQIGMDECQARAGGSRCVTAQTTEYGCAAYALDPRTQSWAGGRGPNLDEAYQDASNHMPPDFSADSVTGGWCSDPLTP